jgi:hypothetical protein
LRSLQEIQPDFEEAKAYAGMWSQGKKDDDDDDMKGYPVLK